MSEISVQQNLIAKTQASASDKGAGNSKAGENISSQTTGQAEVQQAVTMSSAEKQKAEDTQNLNVEKAVAQLNEYVQNTERKLDFQVDEDSGQTVVRVYDKVSEELIRQIPNEEALELAQKLNLEEPLMLFSAQV